MCDIQTEANGPTEATENLNVPPSNPYKHLAFALESVFASHLMLGVFLAFWSIAIFIVSQTINLGNVIVLGSRVMIFVAAPTLFTHAQCLLYAGKRHERIYAGISTGLLFISIVAAYFVCQVEATIVTFVLLGFCGTIYYLAILSFLQFCRAVAQEIEAIHLKSRIFECQVLCVFEAVFYCASLGFALVLPTLLSGNDQINDFRICILVSAVSVLMFAKFRMAKLTDEIKSTFESSQVEPPDGSSTTPS